jgi:carboxyl-terminal processing protease
MHIAYRLLSPAILVASVWAFSQVSPTSAPISKPAAEYLNHALDLIQREALHSAEIDWTAVRDGAFLHSQGAQTSIDTYPGIYFALTQLREHHSFLRVPDDLSDADRKRTRDAMRNILGPWTRGVKPPPPSPFRTRGQPEGHLMHSGNRAFAWVSVPECGAKHSNWQDNLADFRTYATTLHSIAAELSAAHPEGWVIDLRGNGGGNMWPMLAGIGFVLGEGVAGSFVSSDGTVQSDWSYKQGEVLAGTKNMNDFAVGPPLTLLQLPAVAILIDSGTISSGEAIAVSFEGRPHTRFFGTHTFGLSSANSMLPMPDGASLFIDSSVDADRTHHRYDDGIEPDVTFPEPSSLPVESTDPVLQAATSWLASLQ